MHLRVDHVMRNCTALVMSLVSVRARDSARPRERVCGKPCRKR